jgi:hypothetical protein
LLFFPSFYLKTLNTMKARFDLKCSLSSSALLLCLGYLNPNPGFAEPAIDPLLSESSDRNRFLSSTTLEPLPSPTTETELRVENFSPPDTPPEVSETPSPSLAAPFILDELDSDPMAQLPSASQFRDVLPTDWAFEALTSLNQRYNCLAGYPNGTFLGNRPLTRYEFAAGLNACLQQVERLVNVDDLDTLRRLTSAFSVELAALGDRVNALEETVSFLEDNAFSTTTKLFGQVILGLQGRTENTADFFPVDGIPETADPATQINLITNVQLSLVTQFSPNSLLLTGLQAGNGSTAPRLTNDTRLSYEAPTNSDVLISDLTYRHLFGNTFALIAGPVGVNPISVFRGANRIESAGFGPLSAFAQRNPIIAIGGGTAGIGFDWQIFDRLSLQGVYSSSLANDPAIGGLFGSRQGDTTLGFQAAWTPMNNLDVALHLINSYSPLGRLRTGIGDDQVTAGSPVNTTAFGGTVAWQINPSVTLGGWGGIARSRRQGASGTVETTNWMAFLNFPDLFGEGHLGGIYFGQPPKIVSSDLPVGENVPDLLATGIGNPGGQPGTTHLLEVFYRYRVTDYLTLTPGFIIIFDPAHTPNSETIRIGALRATLTF